MRVAVLDLGTNTFNLVIAEQRNGRIKLIHSSKLPVKLGEGGISQSVISPDAFDRGILAISKHYQTIRNLHVTQIKALGTSALRTAKNGNEFLSAIHERTGIHIDIIDGDQEAEYIYYGVRETLNMSDGKYLILDIGGGSNEFIIADSQKIYWKKSYPLGIARLLEIFKPSNPIRADEIREIISYIESFTIDLTEEVEKFNARVLLGASGSFETFVSMIHGDEIIKETEISILPEVFPIPLTDFENLYEKLIVSTVDERENMKGLEPMRTEMIVLASLFVKFILKKLEIAELYQTNFSLKEGVLHQLFKSK